MKIGEYIELVKQAKGPDVSPVPTPPPFNGVTEPILNGPPPVILNNGTEVVSTNSEAPQFLPLDEIKKRNANTNHGVSRPGTPLQLDPAQTGAKPKPQPEYQLPKPDPRTGFIKQKIDPFIRFGRPDGTKGLGFTISDIMKSDPIENPGSSRSYRQYFKDFGNPQAWKDKLKYWKKRHWGKGYIPTQFFKDNANVIPRMLNGLNAPVKPVDFGAFHGLIGKAFPFFIPLSEVKDTVAQNAIENAYLDGFDVDQLEITDKPNLEYRENNPGYWDFWKNYYLPELTKEVGRSFPNILTEGISFMNPTAPLTMTGELLDIIPSTFGYEGMHVPGFYHPHYKQNRSRSNEEWEKLKNHEYINPDQLKQNSDRYGNQNYWIDNGAAYLDPVFRTAGWIADNARYYSPIHRMLGLHKGKPLYEHVMDNVGELIDRPTQYSVDERGRKTVDWQSMLADSSWYDVNGGRPEFRNMSLEERMAKIQPMINKAIKNGFTRDEIERAVELYVRNPGDPDSEGGSLLYTEANLLPMMAMSPAEIYGSMEFQNKVTNPEDIKGIPRTIKRFVPGYMGMGGTWYENENPKWLEAKKSLERRIADQKTLFKLYPFFESLRDSPDQLTSEERDFISNPANLAKVQAMQAPAISPRDIMRKIPISEEDTDNYEEELRSYVISSLLNKLSRLPAQQRYAYFLEYPEVLDLFLDRYYTNEDTKNKIRKFLFPDRATPQELEQIAPVAKPVGTLTSILAPALLKVRQQARAQQQINDAM